jgi:hypothetical protein
MIRYYIVTVVENADGSTLSMINAASMEQRVDDLACIEFQE